MKLYKVGIIFSIFILVFSCSGNPINLKRINPDLDKLFIVNKYNYTPNFKSFNKKGRIYYYIKIWGFLKYHSSNNDNTDWQEIFENDIILLDNLNKKEFNNSLKKILSLNTLQSKKSIKNKVSDYALIDNSWFSDTLYFEQEVINKLHYLFDNYEISKNPNIKNLFSGNLRIKKINDNVIAFPSLDKRLLSLAYYWNIINYFYVYKNYMDDKWDDVLINIIPDFISSKNKIDYYKSIKKLTSHLNDCHSIVRSNELDSIVFGFNVPNFRVKKINNTFIVKKIRVSDTIKSEIQIGDEILSINGVEIEKRYNNLKLYFKGANLPSEQRIITPYIFATNSKFMTLIIRREGERKQIKIKLRNYKYYVNKELELINSLKNKFVAKKINDNTYYVNLEHISELNFNENFEKLRDIKNIILDLRCYPSQKTVYKITDFILPKSTEFFTSTYSDVKHPGMLKINQGYKLGKDSSNSYRGNVYVLVNENTQSMAEFLVMALQTSPKVKIIGSQTAGSNGNVARIYFPGKIISFFSGIGIYYPDFTPTQRIGIRINYNVNQTINGIKNKKDEILNFAIKLITDGGE